MRERVRFCARHFYHAPLRVTKSLLYCQCRIGRLADTKTHRTVFVANHHHHAEAKPPSSRHHTRHAAHVQDLLGKLGASVATRTSRGASCVRAAKTPARAGSGPLAAKHSAATASPPGAWRQTPSASALVWC